MRKTIKTSALLVTGNQLIAEGAVLLRNILLARMLGPEQMGLAIILAITLRCLEMISYLASDRLLVQARDGNTSRFQANAHGLEVARGILSGLMLSALAYPAAVVFGYPEAAWAFAVLGLVPVLRGFIHLDYRRLQRRLLFGPTLKVESIANLVATASVWPAWLLTGNFSALVWISLVQALTLVVLSHGVARRPYRIRFDRTYLGRLLRFGWPMLINSLLMFGVFQGDRLIVALSVSPQQLSQYALALQLGLLPTLVLARGSLALLLPLLARKQTDRTAFQSDYQKTLLLLISAAIVFVISYTLLGNYIITLFFGKDFVIEPLVLYWLGCALAIRIIRIGPGTAALALGDSQTLMRANVWRLGGFFIAAWFGLAGFGLVLIAAAAAIGEVLALTAGVLLLYRRQGVMTPISLLISTIGAITAFVVWTLLPLQIPLEIVSAAALVCTIVTAGLLYRSHQREINIAPGIS